MWLQHGGPEGGHLEHPVFNHLHAETLNPTMLHTVCLKIGKLEFIDLVKQQVAIQFKFTGKILKSIIQFAYSMLLPKMQIN